MDSLGIRYVRSDVDVPDKKPKSKVEKIFFIEDDEKPPKT